MTRSIRTITALFGVAVLVGACGSAGSPTPAATTAAPAAAGAIDIQGFKFPANTDVAKGTKVVWTNKDGTAHTVTSGTRPNKDGKFDGQVAPGATFSFTFTAAGVYQYYCAIHGSMDATITVK
jgi:plastocyanin